MKKWIGMILVLSMLCMAGCSRDAETETQVTEEIAETTSAPSETAAPTDSQLEGEITEITLNGDTISVEGENASGVFTSNDIIYYEDKETYESGNPYGEGEAKERHSAEEAAAHLVVNITAPGNYRLSGQLTRGQVRIDLGEDAYENPDAVVNLILDGVTINCTVAPAILFLNVYECDGNWSTETAQAEVDTSAAGANLILASGSENVVNGSHVAKILKDKEGEKKLWKQDGAIYSYMSMNVAGTGTLDLYADNEGLDTEMHLTINGGNINIRSDNDGINTNEDGVSVTTINGGNIHIIAGLGAEGDGIDSNGYLVINGGTVVASANPAADAGLDSDMGSYINGGTVIALGSTMDWAESDSEQVTMNLQFAQMQSSGSSIVVTDEEENYVFAYDPSEDEVLGENVRQYMGAVISCANFAVGQTYQVYMDAAITGSDIGGVYDVSTVTACEGGVQQAYTGTDVMMRPGGMGGFGGGQRPEGGFGGGGRGERPEGGDMPTMPEGEIPPEWDGGEMPTMPEDWTIPEGEMPQGGFPEGEMPEDFTMPEGMEMPTMPEGQELPEGFGNMGGISYGGEANTAFYMQDKVNFFSGLTSVTE